MNTAELESIVRAIDPVNEEYILADVLIQRQYASYLRWKGKEDRTQIAASVLDDLKTLIAAFDGRYLTPANVRVGDGATVNYYTDRHAGTIVKVTKCSITIQRDKAILDPDFKPIFVPGGFAAHCTNQDEQRYTYERDESGELTTIRWSKKYNRYGTPGDLTASKGRHEFYDYNF